MMNLQSGRTEISETRWQELMVEARDNVVFWAVMSLIDKSGGTSGDALAYACLWLVRENERLHKEALDAARRQVVVFPLNLC